MKSKNYFVKLVGSDLMAEIISMDTQQKSEFITNYALDLHTGRPEICRTTLAKKQLTEAQEYRDNQSKRRKEAWKKDQIDKAKLAGGLVDISEKLSTGD